MGVLTEAQRHGEGNRNRVILLCELSASARGVYIWVVGISRRHRGTGKGTETGSFSSANSAPQREVSTSGWWGSHGGTETRGRGLKPGHSALRTQRLSERCLHLGGGNLAEAQRHGEGG
jgi:hypothetical protein